jgi:hypothetical protein
LAVSRCHSIGRADHHVRNGRLISRIGVLLQHHATQDDRLGSAALVAKRNQARGYRAGACNYDNPNGRPAPACHGHRPNLAPAPFQIKFSNRVFELRFQIKARKSAAQNCCASPFQGPAFDNPSEAALLPESILPFVDSHPRPIFSKVCL